MSLCIDEIRTPSAAEWDDVWRTCPTATFFHGRPWAEIWASYSQGRIRPASLLVRFSDGQSALLIRACTRQNLGLVRATLSSPAGTYGGWISSDPLSLAHAHSLRHQLALLTDRLDWRVNPFDDLAIAAVGEHIERDTTLALDLTGGVAAIRQRWRESHARAVRKAQRAGVEIRIGETEDDWRRYLAIYHDSLARWGSKVSSRYDWPLFSELHRRAADGVRLWLSECDGEPVAGAVVLYSRLHATYWHGAARAEYFDRRPVHLLMDRAIEDAYCRRCAWFDFNPSGGHEGVAAFKRGFGATPLPCPLVRTENVRGRWCRRLATLVRALPAASGNPASG